MRKNILSPRGFKQNKFFAVLAVVMLVALLLMIEKIAEAVVSVGNSAGINMPPVPIFRQTAANIFMVALGIGLLVLSPIFIVPIVKFAIIGAGLALLGYGAYQIYKLFKGEPMQDLLPKK